MAYQERGSGPPHFDGKDYLMWYRRMCSFLHNKGHIKCGVTENTSYVIKSFVKSGFRSNSEDAHILEYSSCHDTPLFIWVSLGQVQMTGWN
jgi:hypothetical protein